MKTSVDLITIHHYSKAKVGQAFAATANPVRSIIIARTNIIEKNKLDSQDQRLTL